ncbi:NTF2 fold immunity protein [Flavobacterium celericrescens]|uniref:NTF2 fold domain-containing protein n=1 Tax=Flavobacterium celericrescens TaxID=2709780 RepID=A0ABX0IFS4_9FLAO|nr:NTF2 fold immunity protein [Flavobacterium celericrescens]NHM04156.1 hypothetical protein [Flavobacterium celericrescens]
MRNSFYIIFFFFIIFFGCAQTAERRSFHGKEFAEKELKAALNQNNEVKLHEDTILIKDSITAIKIAEPILFEIYGEENISLQRPYECYLIENYWVISGTLPEGILGGTFLFIFDSRNNEIIKIIHGK